MNTISIYYQQECAHTSWSHPYTLTYEEGTPMPTILKGVLAHIAKYDGVTEDDEDGITPDYLRQQLTVIKHDEHKEQYYYEVNEDFELLINPDGVFTDEEGYVITFTETITL